MAFVALMDHESRSMQRLLSAAVDPSNAIAPAVIERRNLADDLMVDPAELAEQDVWDYENVPALWQSDFGA